MERPDAQRADLERPDWAPDDVDLDRPSAARVYDYILGGSHNFAIDRALGDELERATPYVAETMRANRHFLRRVVRFLVAQGLDQFVDIGSGIPTVGNVHEIAQQEDPDARIVYDDIDPVAVAHSRRILQGNDRTVVLQADVRDAEAIFAAQELQGLIDVSRPVALLLAGIMHFIPDADDPAAIVAELCARLAPGSHVVISHVTWEDQPPEAMEAQRLSERTPTPLYARSHAEIQAMFDGLEMVEPGLVHFPLWRPDDPADVGEHPERYGAFCGVGRKP